AAEREVASTLARTEHVAPVVVEYVVANDVVVGPDLHQVVGAAAEDVAGDEIVMSAAFDLEHVSAVLPRAVVPRADVIDVIVQEAVVMRALDHPHAVPAVRVLEMAVLDDAVARVREFREMLDSRVRP